jgi:polyferredoxin
MNFIKNKRQSIRLFTPILGLAAMATLGSFLGNSFLLSKYGIEPRDVFVLLLLPVSLLVGNIYCGWLCPAGRVQTILYKLGTLILGKKRQKKWTLPHSINSKLKYFRIILLIVWLAVTVLSVFGLLESEISLYLKTTFGMAFILLSIPFTFTTEQFFCRNFCINGALYGINNKVSKFRIKRSSTCIDCGKCDSVCPMGIQVSKIEKVTANQCITCMACIDNCPKKDAEAIFLK